MRGKKRKILALLLAALTLCLTAFFALAAESATAATMQLMRTEGTVDVTASSGRSLTKRDNMRLYNGYHVETQAASYAWINLDSEKLAKVDAVSEVELRKSGKKLELLLSEGNVFFNITEPLTEEETLNVRTATMVVGIRGTSGWIRTVDRWKTEIYVLEGTVQCDVSDPVTGQVRTATLQSGEKAVAAVYSQDQAEAKCDIIQERIVPEDIDGFVLMELAQDPELCAEILEASGLDVTDVVETARERLAQDQQKMQVQLERVEAQQAAQDHNVSKGSVWEKETAASAPGTSSSSDRDRDDRDGSGSGTAGGNTGGGSTGGNTGGSDSTVPDDSTGDDNGEEDTSTVTLQLPVDWEEFRGYLSDGNISEVILEPGTSSTLNIGDDGYDLEIAPGKTLTLSNGINVTIQPDYSLTVNGKLSCAGTITNYGDLGNNDEITASITNYGTFTSSGTITGSVTIGKSPTSNTPGSFTMTGGTVTSSLSGDNATIECSAGSVNITGGAIANTGGGYALVYTQGATITLTNITFQVVNVQNCIGYRNPSGTDIRPVLSTGAGSENNWTISSWNDTMYS